MRPATWARIRRAPRHLVRRRLLARHSETLTRNVCATSAVSIRAERIPDRTSPAETETLTIGTLDDASVRRLNEISPMEIHLHNRSVKTIRLSAAEAIEEGDTEALREDVMEAFDETQVEEIERRIDSGDFFEFVTDVLDEWSGDDVDELFELLETQLSEIGIDLKYERRDDDEEGEEDADEEEEEDEEDVGFDDDDEDEDDDELQEEEEDDED